MNRPIRNVVFALLLPCLALSGCGPKAKTASMDAALSHYNQHQYSEALEAAVAVENTGTPDQRCDAAYIAGLSAYQLGQIGEAETQFNIARNSSNPETVAKCQAMLGQIRLDQGRPREAATLLAEAAPNLTGDDALRCCYKTGVAYKQAGDAAAAKTWFAKSRGETPEASSAPSAHASSAGASNPTPAASSKSAPAPAGSGFTIQVGAFADKQHADQAAAEAKPLAQSNGLGDIRVMPRKDERGQRVYIVQFGSFPTRDAATAARAKIGKLQYIVVAAANSPS